MTAMVRAWLWGDVPESEQDDPIGTLKAAMAGGDIAAIDFGGQIQEMADRLDDAIGWYWEAAKRGYSCRY